MIEMEKVFCAQCKAERQPVLKKIIRDFAVVGAELVCPVCGAALTPPRKKETPPPPASKPSALSSLLGTKDASEQKTVLDKTADLLRICRDCHWCIFTPFETRCSKHDKLVDPTDDCSDFKPRSEKKQL